RGRCGARMGAAGHLYPYAATLVSVGLARRACQRYRGSWMSSDPANHQAIRHVVVRGDVQGVGFRAWTEYTALARGLEGWVRNRRDSSVEAVFAGSNEAVAAM